MIPYVGNGPYCYANAASMLLAAAGENVPPARIEVLTGVGLGAFWLEDPKLIVFSNVDGAPDTGISKALEILGFQYTERWSPEAGSPPYEQLKADLAKHPALMGPLDMGYLSYNPTHEENSGADHYVLAYDIDESRIYLHDPEGFPHVILPLDDFERAWRAERIAYRRDYYRYWTSPKRVRNPPEEEIYSQALRFFRSLYRAADKHAASGDWIVGQDAILTFANHLRSGKVSPEERGHMVYFAFKLGARRALDFAVFFDFRDSDLGDLKRKQAELFGRCHTQAVLKDWPSLADTAVQLADAEADFRDVLVGQGASG